MSSAKKELPRALSKLGLASRGQAEKWIRAGLVKVNGRVVRDPTRFVSVEKDKIEVAGELAEPIQETLFYMLNKPKNTVTTRSDEKGRKTVYELLPEGLPYLHAVGRLDYATTGLLLFTNDTKLSSFLTDPKNEIPRTYLVTVRGEFTEDKIPQLLKGVKIDGDLHTVNKMSIRKASGRESHLTVTLTEGKNREIRKIFKSIGHEVTALKRISFGRFELGELEAGEVKKVSQDVYSNYKAVKKI